MPSSILVCCLFMYFSFSNYLFGQSLLYFAIGLQVVGHTLLQQPTDHCLGFFDWVFKKTEVYLLGKTKHMFVQFNQIGKYQFIQKLVFSISYQINKTRLLKTKINFPKLPKLQSGSDSLNKFTMLFFLKCNKR